MKSKKITFEQFKNRKSITIVNEKYSYYLLEPIEIREVQYQKEGCQDYRWCVFLNDEYLFESSNVPFDKILILVKKIKNILE
jgi:hypothetical protein